MGRDDRRSDAVVSGVRRTTIDRSSVSPLFFDLRWASVSSSKQIDNMPALRAVLAAANGVAAHLPPVIITDEAPAAVRDALATTGFDCAGEVVARTNACLARIRELTRRRRVDTGDCRLVVLRRVDRARGALRLRVGAAVDRAAGTTRFVVVVDRPEAGLVGPRIWSRAIVAVATRPSSSRGGDGGGGGSSAAAAVAAAAEQRARVAAAMEKLYDGLVAAGRRGTRLDVTTRRAVREASELAVELASVGRVFRAIGRAAVARGDLGTLALATRYAHASARSPLQELVALQSLIIEIAARAGAG